MQKGAWQALVLMRPIFVCAVFALFFLAGVWDVMSSEAVSKFVYQRVKKSDKSEEALKSICELLVSRCLNLGSRDNISVLIVVFNKEANMEAHASKLKAVRNSVCLCSVFLGLAIGLFACIVLCMIAYSHWHGLD